MTRVFQLLFLFACVSFHSLYADNVGLLVMATGKYIRFVQPLISSAEQHFCKDHNLTFFVFTDQQFEESENVKVIYQQRLGWPYDTMMRFEVYYNNREAWAGQDYVYACDADMLFVGDVGDEILSDRVATLHPGFFNKSRHDYSYENNPHSLAGIMPDEGEHYFAGGFYGGKTGEMVHLTHRTSENIITDYTNGLIAVWHDESHLNRYFIDHKPTCILSPSYCYPESFKLPFEKRLLALDKNHGELRKN